MAKEVSKKVKMRVQGGSANPGPPIGPALGAAGVNIMEFCQQFNARTKELSGENLRVYMTVYTDKSFDFEVKSSPSVNQILSAVKKQKGSSEPNRNKVGSLSWDQAQEIAEKKMKDLNAFTIESATKMVAGTARSMGIRVTGQPPIKK
ncbi:MAG: 50S ribosomal protein L11 [Flavobacteriaceae bacterium]|nr:50S ribosomal protein L11 [Flavobacteriaceae bacterium]